MITREKNVPLRPVCVPPESHLAAPAEAARDPVAHTAGAEAMLPLWLEQDDLCLWVLREDTAWLRLSPHMASLKQNELMAC